MNSRQRFLATLNFAVSDQPPLFREGMREETLEAWRKQGLEDDAHLETLFHYDELEELEPDLHPLPALSHWSESKGWLRQLQRRLDPMDERRLPANWAQRVAAWQNRSHVLLLRLHRGFFLSMGVEDWQSFKEAIRLLKDKPSFVHQVLEIQAEFAARLADRILQEVQVDGVIFSEPIAGNHGPLISPAMYADFVLRSYEPILKVVAAHKVANIIMRTYANPRPLLPHIFRSGFNCLWACECNMQTMDYRLLRAELGAGLRLIGGIDADILYQPKEAIQRELMAVLPPLLSQGGYVPLADGRVREDMPFEKYAFYRRMLEEIVRGEHRPQDT